MRSRQITLFTRNRGKEVNVGLQVEKRFNLKVVRKKGYRTGRLSKDE